MEWRAWFEEHRWQVIGIVVIGSIVLFAVGAKFLLFANFLLGNDIVVKLSASGESFALEHAQKAEAEFTTTVTTNPFCEAACTTSFKDASIGQTISENLFLVRPTEPLKESFTVEPFALGEGLRLYQYQVSCQGERTVLCHTKEQPTSRTVLVTVQYTLTPEEEALRSDLQNLLRSLAGRRAEQNATAHELQSLEEALGITPGGTPSAGFEQLFEIEELWQLQNLTLISLRAQGLEEEVTATREALERREAELEDALGRHNALAANLSGVQAKLARLSLEPLLSEALALRINETVEDYETLPLPPQEAVLAQLAGEVSLLEREVLFHVREEGMARSVQAALFSEAICIQEGICPPREDWTTLAQRVLWDLNESCTALERLPLEPGTVPQGFERNVSAQANATLNAIIANLSANLTSPLGLAQLPVNAAPAGNSSLVRAELSSRRLGCDLVVAGRIPQNRSLEHIVRENISAPSPGANFSAPPPVCCVGGACEACCLQGSCRAEAFPVVFVHGHAFNEETSAEYSLDAFREIQDALEEEGFLDAGAITLYSQRDTPQGLWGYPRAQVMLKLSYYFDIFAEPENYVVVQTKSENIDTYAVRLKELLDTVEYKTGKPKVHIVAHSMGGLVARRYFQIFGSERVASITFIATPHHGITGNVADFCPLIGQRLECRDLQEQSLFLRKLSSQDLPDIPSVNIIGTGCEMGPSTGDGIVLERNARLEGTQNVYVNGTCSALEPLHTQILERPEVARIVKEIVSAS